jgi:hypothetical protein
MQKDFVADTNFLFRERLLRAIHRIYCGAADAAE